MTTTERQAPPPNPNTLRDHLANERTFLAWIRTVIALIAMGFVVARFGLVLRELSGTHLHAGSVRFGAVFGVLLVLCGILAALLATARFLQTRRDINSGVVNFRPALDLALGALVVGAGLLLAIYLSLTS